MKKIKPSNTLSRAALKVAAIFSVFSLLTGVSEHAIADETRFSRIDATGEQATVDTARCVTDQLHNLTWQLSPGEATEQVRVRWGGAGAEKTGEIFFDDWNALITQTSKESLCGYNDWRVPTVDELKTLLQPARGDSPWINTEYFPDTLPEAYWSVSSYANYPEHGQTVHFGNGNSYYYHGYRGNPLLVRLVRGNTAE